MSVHPHFLGHRRTCAQPQFYHFSVGAINPKPAECFILLWCGSCFSVPPSQHLRGLWNAQTARDIRRSKPHGLLTACMQYKETLRRKMSIQSDYGLNLIVGHGVL